MPEIVTV